MDAPMDQLLNSSNLKLLLYSDVGTEPAGLREQEHSNCGSVSEPIWDWEMYDPCRMGLQF